MKEKKILDNDAKWCLLVGAIIIGLMIGTAQAQPVTTISYAQRSGTTIMDINLTCTDAVNNCKFITYNFDSGTNTIYDASGLNNNTNAIQGVLGSWTINGQTASTTTTDAWATTTSPLSTTLNDTNKVWQATVTTGNSGQSEMWIATNNPQINGGNFSATGAYGIFCNIGNGCRLVKRAGSTDFIYKAFAGTFLANTQYVLKLTRRIDGNWSYYLDGTYLGSATDTNFNTDFNTWIIQGENTTGTLTYSKLQYSTSLNNNFSSPVLLQITKTGSGTHTINYYSTNSLDQNETTNTTNLVINGRLKFNVYDENTGNALTGVTINDGTTDYNTGLNNYLDYNIQSITTNTTYNFTLSKTGYGTRYYTVDLNQSVDLNINFQLLSTSLGQLVYFRFFEPNQSTKISSKYIEVLDYITLKTSGRLKTTPDGDINFFLNLNDSNFHFLINNGEFDYNTLILTINKPKDEDTGLDINAAWNVILSGLASQSVIGTSNAYNLFYLYSNTTDTYRVQIDSNATPAYTSRVYLLNYLGNPLTATLQPYLLLTSSSVLTKINTLQQTSLSITSLPGIVVKIYKNVPNQGVVLIQQVQTDGKGQAAVTLKTGDTYQFNLYQNGVLISFNNLTTIPINVITTTISFTVSTINNIVVNPRNTGFSINWSPLDSGVLYASKGSTFDTNVTIYNKLGTAYSASIRLYNNGSYLTGSGFPDSYSGFSNVIFRKSVPWGSLVAGDLILVVDINQDTNHYVFTTTYNLYSNNTNGVDNNYSFDLLDGLRNGIKTDLGCATDQPCAPLVGVSLLLIFCILGVVTVSIGSFGGQGTVGIALVLMAFFTFINWLPIELTAIAFIAGAAFMFKDVAFR